MLGLGQKTSNSHLTQVLSFRANLPHQREVLLGSFLSVLLHSGAPLEVTLQQACRDTNTLSVLWMRDYSEQQQRRGRVCTGDGAVDVGAAARHLFQRLPALVRGQTQGGDEGGGGGRQEVRLGRDLVLDCAAASATKTRFQCRFQCFNEL